MAAQGHDFIKAVVQLEDHAPAVICYTKQMMDDLKSALTNEPGTILGIDKTFNLGPCYVTSFIFSNYAFTRKSTSNSPIFWGPMYLHGSSLHEDFHTFTSHVSSKLRTLNKIKVGSDDEKSLVSAIEDSFVKSRIQGVHTLCVRHIKNNVSDYLRDKVGVSQEQRALICDKLFGKGGITDSVDSVEYELKCQTILETYSNMPVFISYLRNTTFPKLLAKVLHPVWFDNIPHNWTNNSAESGNHIMKMAIDWKAQSLQELVSTLHQLVKEQYMEVTRALAGKGVFTLTDHYKQYEVDPRKWVSKSANQREKLLNSFICSRKRSSSGVVSTDGKLTINVCKGAGRKPHQQNSKRSERATQKK